MRKFSYLQYRLVVGISKVEARSSRLHPLAHVRKDRVWYISLQETGPCLLYPVQDPSWPGWEGCPSRPSASVNLFTSLCSLLPRQLHSKQKPRLPPASSKLGARLFCWPWGRRRGQTAAFVSQSGESLLSVTAAARWGLLRGSSGRPCTLTHPPRSPWYCTCRWRRQRRLGGNRISCTLPVGTRSGEGTPSYIS